MQMTMRTLIACWQRESDIVMPGVRRAREAIGEGYKVHRVKEASPPKSARDLTAVNAPKPETGDKLVRVRSRDEKSRRAMRTSGAMKGLARENPPMLAPGRVRVCEICMAKNIPFYCRCPSTETTPEEESEDPTGGQSSA